MKSWILRTTLLVTAEASILRAEMRKENNGKHYQATHFMNLSPQTVQGSVTRKNVMNGIGKRPQDSNSRVLQRNFNAAACYYTEIGNSSKTVNYSSLGIKQK